MSPLLLAGMISISNQFGTVTVSLRGANAVSYVPRGGTEVLARVEKSDLFGEDFYHGGVPVVWPWFGPLDEKDLRTLHGFVRMMDWRVAAQSESSLTLEIASSAETKKRWPHDFRLRSTFTLDADGLQEKLDIVNTGTGDFVFNAGFHSYFKVSDNTRLLVRGLDGCRRTEPLEPFFRVSGDYRVSPTDDYLFEPGKGKYAIVDAGLGRRIELTASGHRDIIVWTDSQKDFSALYGPGEIKTYCCFEPVIYGPEHSIRLGPGESHLLSLRMKAVPLSASPAKEPVAGAGT